MKLCEFTLPLLVCREQFTLVLKAHLLSTPDLGLFIHLRLSLFHRSHFFFDHFFEVSHHIRLHFLFLVIFFWFGLTPHKSQAVISVSGEVIFLLSLPYLYVGLDRVEHKTTLLMSELSILTHGVQTYDEFLLTGNIVSSFSGGKFTFFFVERLAITESFLAAVIEIFEVSDLLLLNGVIILLYFKEICDSCIKSMVCQAVVIYKGHRHV